jgi:hypothetical protein
MSRLVRKNLMLDPEKVRDLARRKGMSESAAVRQLIDFALAAEEITEIVEELRARGGIDDVFGKLDPEWEIEGEKALAALRRKSRRKKGVEPARDARSEGIAEEAPAVRAAS